MRFPSFALTFLTATLAAAPLSADEPLLAGFAEADITPDLQNGRPVWIAGYGQNRRAEGVHDPLTARCVALRHGESRIALVAVDLIGLQYPEVVRIRRKLPDFDYVMVASTHNHEGPDTIGLWGPSPFSSGVDPAYLDLVVARVANCVREANRKAVPVTVRCGTAQDDTLLGDSRQPRVYDGVLRALQFNAAGDGAPVGLLVQWNCHPESLGSRNKLLTADFPHYTMAALQVRRGCPVAFFSGAVGGLMAPPDNRVKDAAGEFPQEGDFEYARLYGEEVAALAEAALNAAAPVELTPLRVSARPITVPLANHLYQAARAFGVLKRAGRQWTGDFDQLGPPLADDAPPESFAVETEVACLRLGELHVACIPGELYPELVYGQFQEPADAGADFPDAALEKPVASLLPGEKWLLFGLANDEIGYIIPKRQWDEVAPFAYGREKPQYGEINSVGPEVAPILMRALERRVGELEP
jgi:hypothetical protein